MDDMKRTSEYRRMLPFIAKASNDVGDDTQGEDIQALILALNTHKSSDDHDGRYYTESETDTLLGYKADKTLTLTAGDGLTGGGDLSTGRTFAVGAGTGITVNADDVAINLAANLTWTGAHTFSGSLITGSIMPALADVYDLGDYTKPWRKIWGSELSSVVFSQYEQVLLGGWLTISKGEGKLSAAVVSTDTQIDLGAAFTADDILVFRSISSNGTPQVEYMKVGTLVSGTTYNVTRDLDTTGANNWPEGTVFGNWGTTGNGRVELNAYDEPRMSVYSHGAAIADFREQVRIGDLNGGWGYSSSVFGGAFGAYESGKANITIDPTNGIRIRNYNVDVIKLTGTEASFENFITLGANGGIRQGTGTWGSSFTGTAIWSESSVMDIGGWNAGIKQWWGGSDGKFYAGTGNLLLDVNGLTIKALDSWITNRTIKFTGYDDEILANIYATASSAYYNRWLYLSLPNTDYYHVSHLVLEINSASSAEYCAIDLSSSVGEDSSITYTASGGHTFVGPNDGWNRITDTWTYASATTITVPSGAASIYSVGDKFRLTANSVVLQGYIVTVANTLLTVVGDALTNHTFSAVSYSKAATPLGFPQWFNYTPTYEDGWTALPTGTYRFNMVGKMVYTRIAITAGTSDSVEAAIGLPVNASSTSSLIRGTWGWGQDNGTQVNPAGGYVIDISNHAIRFFKTSIDGADWTASGTKRIYCTFFYEAA